MPKHAGQSDLFRGLRLFVEPTRKVRLEGSVENAARCTGLATRTIHHYIAAGEIETRQPGANRRDAEVPDSLGRDRRFKHLVNMRDVFRIAYGEQVARETLKQLGLDYD